MELESLRQSVAAFSIVLATAATLLVPNCICLVVPLDLSSVWVGGDLLLGQQLVLHITLPWLAPWRGHSSFASQC